MKKNFLSLTLTGALLLAGSAQAWDCKYEKAIDLSLDLAGTELLSVAAAAGDLNVTGNEAATAARVRGKLCVSEEEWLSETEVHTEGGRKASVAVSLPQTGGWGFVADRYAYLDLEIEVPTGLALDIRDSSGDVEVRGTGPVTLQDSSGDIELEDVEGGAVLKDSSGDIELQRIVGDVTVRQDSSGDIYGKDIEGSVLIEHDSSGDIRFEQVSGDYVVQHDSSGDIVAKTIGGDFRVLRDGSGEVRHSDVAGEVEVPE
ncbi:MAG TPA: hypothetical protein VK827_11580 [Lysobacter sp.]|nr:hypothetical protein [Lysobacter sp.]